MPRSSRTNIFRRLANPRFLSALLPIALIAAVIIAFFAFGLEDDVTRFLRWVKSLGALGYVLFVLVYIANVIFILPGFPFTLGAGFIFGVVKGSICVVLGLALGSACAFLIGRYLFGNRLTLWIRSRPKLLALENEFSRAGFKIILLTRLTPFFPLKLSNYFFGIARFRLKDVFWGTLLGVIPNATMSVYIGSLIADITTLRTGNIQRGPLQWLMAGVGLIVAIVLVTYISRLARKALKNSK